MARAVSHGAIELHVTNDGAPNRLHSGFYTLRVNSTDMGAAGLVSADVHAATARATDIRVGSDRITVSWSHFRSRI